MRVYDMDQLAEFGNLRQINDGKNDLFSCAAESALAVQECSTMTDFPKNAIGNFQRLSGYDERRFSLRGEGG